MFSYIDFQIETAFILAAAALLLQWIQRRYHDMEDIRQDPSEDDLYNMLRSTGVSEYEIFQESAEQGPVSDSMVEKHFTEY